jgi:hypothetical protein
LTLDQIYRAKANSKEMQIVKHHKEAIERAETLYKGNKDLEKKVEVLAGNLEDKNLDVTELQEKYSQQFL